MMLCAAEVRGGAGCGLAYSPFMAQPEDRGEVREMHDRDNLC